MSKKSKENKIKKQNKNQKKMQMMKASVFLRIIRTIIIVLILSLCAIWAYKLGYKIFEGDPVEPFPGREVEVEITDDMSNGEIAELLEKKGLVFDSLIFKIQISLFTNSDYGITKGKYALNTSMKPKELIDTMSSVLTKDKETKEELGLYDFSEND